MSVLERLKQQTRRYQDQYRREHDMLTDEQIDVMGRRLAYSFLDYFKKEYGPTHTDSLDALRQKIGTLAQEVGDLAAKSDDRDSFQEELDEKFGKELDAIKAQLTVMAGAIEEAKQHSVAVRKWVEEELEETGADIGALHTTTRNHTESISTLLNRATAGSFVQAIESNLGVRPHDLVGVVERLQEKVEKLEGRDKIVQNCDRNWEGATMDTKALWERVHRLEGHFTGMQGEIAEVREYGGDIKDLKSRTDEDAKNIATLRESVGCLDKRIIAGETSRAELRDRLTKFEQWIRITPQAQHIMDTISGRVVDLERRNQDHEARLQAINQFAQQNQYRIGILESDEKHDEGEPSGEQVRGCPEVIPDRSISERIDKILALLEQQCGEG